MSILLSATISYESVSNWNGVKRQLRKLFRHVKLFFSCDCEEDDLDWSQDCDLDILNGLDCNICYIKGCHIRIFRTATWNGGKTLRFAHILQPGFVFKTIGASIDSIDWEATLTGEKPNLQLGSKVTLEMSGVTSNTDGTGTLDVFCKLLNKGYVLGLTDCLNQRFMLGSKKTPMCITEGTLQINKETNKFTVTFETTSPIYRYNFTFPK